MRRHVRLLTIVSRLTYFDLTYREISRLLWCVCSGWLRFCVEQMPGITKMASEYSKDGLNVLLFPTDQVKGKMVVIVWLNSEG